jgi:hypothetical protein
MGQFLAHTIYAEFSIAWLVNGVANHIKTASTSTLVMHAVGETQAVGRTPLE